MPDYSAIVSKFWNYAHVLKNVGVGYGGYVKQIAWLLFGSCPWHPGFAQTYRCLCPAGAFILKLADEMAKLGFDNPIPAELKWSDLTTKNGDDLEHFKKVYYPRKTSKM